MAFPPQGKGFPGHPLRSAVVLLVAVSGSVNNPFNCTSERQVPTRRVIQFPLNYRVHVLDNSGEIDLFKEPGVHRLDIGER
jgi:hypothetical protein